MPVSRLVAPGPLVVTATPMRPRRARVAVRRHGRTLFMSHRNNGHRRMPIDRVKHVNRGSSGHAKRVGYPSFRQEVCDVISQFHGRSVSSLNSRVAGA